MKFLPVSIRSLGYYPLCIPYLWRSRSVRDFASILKQVRPYTMVVPSSLAALFSLVKEIDDRGVEGVLVECGVCNGGSAAVMAFANMTGPRTRDLWLFDSFQGLPATTPEDGKIASDHIGTCLGSPETVLDILGRVGTPSQRVRMVKGWFEETLPRVTPSKIALLHVDADWYDSVRLCLEHLYDKVSPGGVIVFNDYGTWPGAKRAVDEFLGQREPLVKLHWVDPGTRYFRKPE